jgi:hypothetical protein
MPMLYATVHSGNTGGVTVVGTKPYVPRPLELIDRGITGAGGVADKEDYTAQTIHIIKWDFKFSRRGVWRWLSSGMLRRVGG